MKAEGSSGTSYGAVLMKLNVNETGNTRTHYDQSATWTNNPVSWDGEKYLSMRYSFSDTSNFIFYQGMGLVAEGGVLPSNCEMIEQHAGFCSDGISVYASVANGTNQKRVLIKSVPEMDVLNPHNYRIYLGNGLAQFVVDSVIVSEITEYLPFGEENYSTFSFGIGSQSGSHEMYLNRNILVTN